LHEGGRSEYYALLAFSSLGTAIPVPRQEDGGLDLYCTLTEGNSKRAWPRAYYAVQVKSDESPWVINDERSVEALVHFPLPLFLCVVTKKAQRLRVYHTSPRFHVWTNSSYPSCVHLLPGKLGKDEASETQWADGEAFRLGVPILDFRVHAIEQGSIRDLAKTILMYWAGVDQENLHLVRHGLRSFIVPGEYETNRAPSDSRVIQSRLKVPREDLDRSAYALRAPLDGESGQLFHHDLLSAVRGLLLLRQLYWGERHDPSAINWHSNRLTALLGETVGAYPYTAIDKIGSEIDLRILRSLGDRAGEHLRDVRRLYLTGPDVRDDDLAVLRSATGLEHLELVDTSITDAGLEYLQGLGALRALAIYRFEIANPSEITDYGLSSIAKLVQLQDLRIGGSKITSAGIPHLRSLNHLVRLALNNTQLNNSGLEPLGKLESLEQLYLDRTKVTNRGLRYLKPSLTLHTISCEGTAVTVRAREALLKALPGWNKRMREAEE
jgi:hypothetical protein